jgi:hypothetical protein
MENKKKEIFEKFKNLENNNIIVNFLLIKTFNSFFISHKRQISRFLKSLNVAEIKCIHANGNTDSHTEYLKTSTKTKKSIFLTFITTYGLTNNEYYRQLVQNSLSLDDLFLD